MLCFQGLKLAYQVLHQNIRRSIIKNYGIVFNSGGIKGGVPGSGPSKTPKFSWEDL